MTHLVEMGEPIPDNFPSEVVRLEQVGRRLARLSGDATGEPTPQALHSLVTGAVQLVNRLKDVDPPIVEPVAPVDLPAVLVNEPRGLRALLLFVDLANRCADGGVDLRLEGDVDGVALSFPGDPGRSGDTAALSAVLALDGGAVRWTGGRCRLSLPSLKRARAEGR